jgi:tRNA (guanosine-2'-O-)-methyltransferase
LFLTEPVMPLTERRLGKFRSVLARRQPTLTVVMENIHDPHNVSAVFRSCDAVGVMRVELLYTVERFPRIGKKSSSSANKWIERRNSRSAPECFSRLRSEGFHICASRLGGEAVSLYELDLTTPVALVFGNEHRGVSDEAASGADTIFQIPMAGMIQSLNVSAAAAVTLYEAMRQRMRAGMYDHPSLDPVRLGALLDAWTAKQKS